MADPATGANTSSAYLQSLQELVKATNAQAQTLKQTLGQPLTGDVSGTPPGPITINGGVVTAAKMATGAAAGNLGFTPLNPTKNLSDLANAQLSQQNLGLGTAATKNVTSGAATYVAGVAPGGVIVGHAATFQDTGGTIGDGGQLGIAARQTYAAANWTPSLQLGGSTVGITYGTQVATYTRIGQVVFCIFQIVLTSKGAAAGAATIAGLPFAATVSSNIGGGGSAAQYSNMAGLVGVPIFLASSGANFINLSQFNAANMAAVTDANFTNTTLLAGEFFYFTQ